MTYALNRMGKLVAKRNGSSKDRKWLTSEDKQRAAIVRREKRLGIKPDGPQFQVTGTHVILFVTALLTLAYERPRSDGYETLRWHNSTLRLQDVSLKRHERPSWNGESPSATGQTTRQVGKK